MMNKILVTGGCGYIGSHTMVDLIQNGFEVISVDNLSNGHLRALYGAEMITGKKIKNYKVDLCNLEDTEAIFEENADIVGIIHFAAFKSVPESMVEPAKYFRNNLNSLVNLLNCALQNNVHHFIFSSSCSVYGNANVLPVTEETPFANAESPYARTKQMGEQICSDFCNLYAHFQATILRYFNPAGAHPSALLGELQEVPENLVPVITQTAIGIRKEMKVFGNDYPTKDGTCIRDYVHVMDIAHAHTLALQHSLREDKANNLEIFNLGTGKGVSVLELIKSFEKVNGETLHYQIDQRRNGDVMAIYANNDLAKKLLNWTPQFQVEDIMRTAWKWEQQMNNEKQSVLN